MKNITSGLKVTSMLNDNKIKEINMIFPGIWIICGKLYQLGILKVNMKPSTREFITNPKWGEMQLKW